MPELYQYQCIQMEKTMERIVEWEPAYDKRHSDPNKDYGVHGMNLRFVLKGPRGAVQFLLFTNWYLPQNRHNAFEKVSAHILGPLPADVGYHALVPQYDGQEAIEQSCPYLDGAPCYYDGSGLAAQELFDRFVAEGEGAVWSVLEASYKDLKHAKKPRA